MWTDYPFVELGDLAGQRAPIRPCVLLRYDGSKYCDVKVHGRVFNIKRGYIYLEEGRCGEARCISHVAACLYTHDPAQVLKALLRKVHQHARYIHGRAYLKLRKSFSQ